jgi:sugar diacid utilization regulator
VERRLGALARDDDEHARLRSTLRVLLEEHGNRPAAARRLGIHPNTVSNRVRTCESLLPDGALVHGVDVQVALLFADTLGVGGSSRR